MGRGQVWTACNSMFLPFHRLVIVIWRNIRWLRIIKRMPPIVVVWDLVFFLVVEQWCRDMVFIPHRGTTRCQPVVECVRAAKLRSTPPE